VIALSTGTKSQMIALAPMEGVVDDITRDLLTKIGGVDLVVTEFIRVLGLTLPEHVFYRDASELRHEGPLRSHTKAGTPLLVQLLGSDPEALAANARVALSLGAVGIDLNFGCPAKTVNRHDGGATLLKDPTRIEEIVTAVRAATPETHSVSAKVRLGFHDKSLHREIAQAAEAGGASWLTVHARTRDEGYRPPAHWEYIGTMREAVKIPVIANGEVWTPEDYHRMREVSGCEHAMIGRGLLARPSLALECKGQSELWPWEKVLPFVVDFVDASNQPPKFSSGGQVRGARFASARLKQWLKSLQKTYPEAATLFERLKTRDTIETSDLGQLSAHS
jgi:tRNA-dihydrouridine synthase C